MHTTRTTFAALLLLAILMLPAYTQAIGIIVPREPQIPPPQLTRISIDADIKDHIARTRVTQLFKNTFSRPVEADFYFPVPDGADITDFVLYMDGKPVRGEILDKEKARDIYREIVRKTKDPGLVEWSDKNLFRIRIFPIPANGEQKMEIEIAQSLPADQGYYRYQLPVHTEKHHADPAPPTLDLNLKIRAAQPLRNIYSPTHQVDINTSDPKVASITLKNEEVTTRDNFILYYETSGEDLSVGLITHRISEDATGYFSLRISPPWDDEVTTTPPSDYIFIVDSSGSMSSKIGQAKKALQYCINSLDGSDRFSLIRFSTTVDHFEQHMQAATQPSKEAANQWIEALEARGGTNIHGALQAGLDVAKASGSTSSSATSGRLTIVFLTDGLPTVGQTSSDAILELLNMGSDKNLRVFTFGLGNDVNTRLLDSIAEKTHAASDYIAPETDLEVPISRFFDKVSRPALTNVKLSIPGAEVTEVYPPQLSDLFFGTELSVYGQYKKPGLSPIIVTGNLGGQTKEFKFEKDFSKADKENDFVEKLWATRKVAWLIDQVRKSGESDELKNEITELAKKHSIVTPYTSYLAMEDEPIEQQQATAPPFNRPQRPNPSLNLYSNRTVAAQAKSSHGAPASQIRAGSFDLKEESGYSAVSTARRLGQMKAADKIQATPATSTIEFRAVNGKTFKLTDGIWKDDAISGNESRVLKIKYLSDAWFQLLEEIPDFRAWLELGEKVQLLSPGGVVLKVGTEGIDSIALSDIQMLKGPDANKK